MMGEYELKGIVLIERVFDAVDFRLPSKTASRQLPKPARTVPSAVIRIGSITDG